MTEINVAVQAVVPRPGLTEIFLAFAKASLASLGGGISSWMMIELVDRKNWVTREEFLGGLALSQALPGVNVVNMAIWFGHRFRGGMGAFAAVLGMVVPATVLAIAVLGLYETIAHDPLAEKLLAGAIAASIGLSISMAARSLGAVGLKITPVAVLAITFVALSVFRLPLVHVVLVMAPASIFLAYLRLRRMPRSL